MLYLLICITGRHVVEVIMSNMRISIIGGYVQYVGMCYRCVQKQQPL